VVALIAENCSENEEEVEDITNINDVHNGVFTTIAIHNVFDRHMLAILKVQHMLVQVLLI